MTRPVTERMAQALRLGWPRVVLVSIDHPSGTGRFCTGLTKRVWNGFTWYAAGKFGGLSPVKRSGEVAVQDVTFSISGIDPELLAKLDEDVRNREGNAWLACIDPYGDVVPDPYWIVTAELDTQSFDTDDDGTVSISIVGHTGFYTLDRALDEAWTPENQHFLFPGDTGMDRIPKLVKQDLQWHP